MTTRHPWETVRARFFTRLLADPRFARRRLDVLDVGAGDGFVAGRLLQVLPAGSTVTCYDPEYAEDHLAVLRESAPAGLSFERVCPDREFDVIVLLDVLEHIPDDRGFLRGLVDGHLHATGHLLISVPAHHALFTQHDVALGHQRRYSTRELHGVIGQVGLTPLKSGSLFGSLIVPRAFAKALERARGIRSEPAAAGLADRVATGVSQWQHGPVVTSAVCRALEIDARLCELAARFTVPNTGLSVWALCERAR